MSLLFLLNFLKMKKRSQKFILLVIIFGNILGGNTDELEVNQVKFVFNIRVTVPFMNNMFPVNVTGYATDSSNIGDCRIFQIDFGGFTHALFNMDFLTKYTRNVGLGNLHYVASCRGKEKLDIGIYVNTTECDGDRLTSLDIEKHGGINK